MKTRIQLVLASCAVALPAYATSGFTPGEGVSSGSYHIMPSSKTRDQVIAELADRRRNPVTASGWRQIEGDAGWEFVGLRGPAKTRAQVSRDLTDSRANLVALDEWAFVGGEVGWARAGDASRMAAPQSQARARSVEQARAARR